MSVQTPVLYRWAPLPFTKLLSCPSRSTSRITMGSLEGGFPFYFHSQRNEKLGQQLEDIRRHRPHDQQGRAMQRLGYCQLKSQTLAAKNLSYRLLSQIGADGGICSHTLGWVDDAWDYARRTIQIESMQLHHRKQHRGRKRRELSRARLSTV